MKAKKEVDQLEKRLNEERKIAYDEGNKMIRIANYQRFNIINNEISKFHPKYPWGVDQRKVSLHQIGVFNRILMNSSKRDLTHKRKMLQQTHKLRQSKKISFASSSLNKIVRLDDKERRKVLGLDYLDEDKLQELRDRALREKEINQTDRQEEQSKE